MISLALLILGVLTLVLLVIKIQPKTGEYNHGGLTSSIPVRGSTSSCQIKTVELSQNGDGSFSIPKMGDLLLDIKNDKDDGSGLLITEGAIIARTSELPLVLDAYESLSYLPKNGSRKSTAVYGVLSDTAKTKLRESKQVLGVTGFC